MALYPRLMGLEGAGDKIPVHQFFAAMQEFALGQMTGAQVVAAFALDAGEQTEATTLYNKIMAEASTNGGIARRVKAREFEGVLMLAERRVAPYTTALAVTTRLGV